jgi:hypothetical protein
VKVARVDSTRRVPGGELREENGDLGAQLPPERRHEDVVERGSRRVRGPKSAEDDVDGVVRHVVEHLEPPELREDGVDVGSFACGCQPVRDRAAHRLLHHRALSGVHHSSLPSWRSRRAMMLRCTSAVPP